MMIRTILLLTLLVATIHAASNSTILARALATGTTGRPGTGGTTGRTTPRMSTTPKPYTICYFCGTPNNPCPQPFSSRSVPTISARSKWCEKIGPVKGNTGSYSRGEAVPGHCSRSGCYNSVYAGQNVEICCCNRDYCNTGLLSTRSTFALIVATLASLFFFRQ